jgi:putative addiction module component (TIGR02574 family)
MSTYPGKEIPMPNDLAALGLDKLSVQERLDLIETLWDSLPDQVERQEIPAWHLVELAKRRAEAIANPGAGKPWRDVLADLEAKS